MTAISQLNGGVALAATADGDLLPITDVSDTTEDANGTTKKITLNNLAAGVVASTAGAAALAAKAPYNSVRDETGTSFTLGATNHSNRATYAANAAAIVATWDTGHGMTKGDIGRIYQTAAGRVSVVAGTGTLELSPGVLMARTDGSGSWLDWEYMGSNLLKITSIGQNSSTQDMAESQHGYYVANGIGLSTISAIGMAGTPLDSSTTGTGASTSDGTNPYPFRRRVRWSSAAAAINRVAGFYSSSTIMRAGDTSAGRWPIRLIGSISDAIASCTFAMGITRAVPPTWTAVEPSALTDVVLMAADTTDTNMQIMHNDGSGACTKIDLGASFPVGQFKMYSLFLDMNIGGTEYRYEVKNLETEVISRGTLTTNLPSTSQTYNPAMGRSSMANASTVSIDMMGVWIGKP
jgi:hypothetical protein